MSDDAEQVEPSQPLSEAPRARRPRTGQRGRRVRLALLALLAPIALIVWQWSLTVEVTAASDRLEHPTGPISHVPDLISSRSRVLDDFFRSDAFDPYAAWFARHQASQDQAQERAQCASARRRVFLPILTRRVERACQTLLGTSTTSRSLAFSPVLIEFFRTCREEGERKTHQADQVHPASPYSDEQWAALEGVITRAVKAGCTGAVTA